MDRNGVVVEQLAGERVKVKLLRHTACGSCGACHLGDDAKNISLAAINRAGAQIGDHVQVALPTSSVLSAAFIVYMVPLIGLFSGIGFSMLAGLPELTAFGIGIGVMALVFVVIRLANQRFASSNKYIAEITAILEPELFPIAPDSCSTPRDPSDR